MIIKGMIIQYDGFEMRSKDIVIDDELIALYPNDKEEFITSQLKPYVELFMREYKSGALSGGESHERS